MRITSTSKIIKRQNPKVQMNISHGHTWKNSQQSTGKSNPAIQKKTGKLSAVCLRNARLTQCLKNESTYKATVIKTKCIGERICESVEQNRSRATQTGAKAIQWKKDRLPNNQCWSNWTATCKKCDSRQNMHLLKKLTQNADLNLKGKTRKLLEDIKGEKIQVILGLGKSFRHSMIHRRETEKGKSDSIKMSFCSVKDAVKIPKGKATG